MSLKLKPSHRMKKRYILFIARSNEEIEEAIMEYLGQKGYSDALVRLIEKKDNWFIYAVNRKSLELIRASIEMSSKDIKIKKVSGTLKGLINR